MDRRFSSLARITLVVVGWAVARAWMFLHLNFQQGDPVDLQDVNLFAAWTDSMASTLDLPTETSWQYPPGAVGVFMLPAAFPGESSTVYLALFLLCDALILGMLLRAERGAGHLGSWVWVSGIPLLMTLSLLRFDMVPTVIAVAALLALRSQRSSVVVGAILGFGAAVKAWPVLLLVAIVARKRAVAATAAAVGVGIACTLVVQLVFGDALGFLANQGGRGLQIESVAASPWYALQAVAGEPVVWEARFGSLEITSSKADALAAMLRVGMIVVLLLAAAAWWLASRPDAFDEPRSRSRFGIDLAFVVLLAYVVISPVLSPQYFVWLLGVGAFAVTDAESRMRRPVLIVLGAAALTAGLLMTWGGLVSNGSDAAYLLVARNAVLVAALVVAIVRIAPDLARVAASLRGTRANRRASASTASESEQPCRCDDSQDAVAGADASGWRPEAR